MSQLNATEIARYIDHTLLKPDARPAALDTLCAEAKQYNFKSVCVNSGWAAYVAEKLQGSDVAVCCVVGFPLGAMESQAKAFETKRAVELGAREIDMVINIGALKSGNLALVKEDMEAVRQAAPQPIVLKVIIETCLLTDEEKATVCQLAKEIGADFVKTSTGFAGGGATVEDVALMRKTVGPDMGVKASGGVRDIAAAKAMIAAGATRLGTSSGIAIVTGAEGKEGY